MNSDSLLNMVLNPLFALALPVAFWQARHSMDLNVVCGLFIHISF